MEMDLKVWRKLIANKCVCSGLFTILVAEFVFRQWNIPEEALLMKKMNLIFSSNFAIYSYVGYEAFTGSVSCCHTQYEIFVHYFSKLIVSPWFLTVLWVSWNIYILLFIMVTCLMLKHCPFIHGLIFLKKICTYKPCV